MNGNDQNQYHKLAKVKELQVSALAPLTGPLPTIHAICILMCTGMRVIIEKSYIFHIYLKIFINYYFIFK